MDAQLSNFVDHAREKGLDHATIRQLLLSAGWREKEIAEVFCRRYLELPIPEPAGIGPASERDLRPSDKPMPRKARDAFLNLLAYGALYAWVTSLILLLFNTIDFAFPDPAWRTSQRVLELTLSTIRAQLAVLSVAFPVFLIVWNYLVREVGRNPAAGKSVIRRWVGYFSLFVAALTLSGNAIALIYFLLEGQLTIRFLLKAAALFLIPGGIVGYLAFTLHDEVQTPGRRRSGRMHSVFSALTAAIVVLAGAWGGVLVGTPNTARLQRFDQQRLDDLQTIYREVQSLCQDPDLKDELKRPLPTSLDELSLLARSRRINLTDPETGQRYIYTVKDETTYELCATFSQPRNSDAEVFWNHPTGEHCFTVDALDPP